MQKSLFIMLINGYFETCMANDRALGTETLNRENGV